MESVPVRHRKRKRRPRRRTSGWSVRYALGAYLAIAAVGMAVGLVLLLMPHSDLRLGIGGIALDAAMLGCFVPLYRRRAFRARDLGLRSAPAAKSVGLVFLAVVAIAIVNALWLHGVLGLKQPDSLGITLHGGTLALVLAGFFVSVSAPVTEELFFRGLLYRALRNRMRVAPAALVAGVLFGLIHGLSFPLDTLPPRVVFGVIACLLYEETGSLLPGIALHCLIDAAGFEAAVTGHNRIVFSIFIALGALLLLYAAGRYMWQEGANRIAVYRLNHGERRTSRQGADAVSSSYD
jgi:membrane protease YdiL (CAAX protease family)